jgi:hypothetical protein
MHTWLATAVAQEGVRPTLSASRMSSSPPPRASLLHAAASSNSLSASASPPGFHGLFAAPLPLPGALYALPPPSLVTSASALEARCPAEGTLMTYPKCLS